MIGNIVAITGIFLMFLKIWCVFNNKTAMFLFLDILIIICEAGAYFLENSTIFLICTILWCIMFIGDLSIKHK